MAETGLHCTSHPRRPNILTRATDAKRIKIKELLTYIEERLAELEEEKEELKEFQEKDKERRCLEYALYQRELTEVGQQLEEVSFISVISPRIHLRLWPFR